MKSGQILELAVERFRFLSCDYDRATGEARLVYAFDRGEPLVERIVFPHAPWPADPSRQAAFERALALLHLIAGISYYKTCIPRQMDPGPHTLGPELVGFLEKLYLQGLAEFAFSNQVSLAGRINFPRQGERIAQPLDLVLPERALLAMGGGKDSLVSLDLLQRAGVEIQPVCVGASPLIADTVRAAGLPLLQIRRSLAPELLEMNAAGALNGHVPVTAINSAILLCASILYGFAWVVFSNEHSASEATRLDGDGQPVNHQYSKSLEFEHGFRDVIRRWISPDIEYFSLLRPCTELAIARRFADLREFHAVFSSCNRNFHQEGTRLGERRWCGDCPKCRFTTLALAPFLPPQAIEAFMGVNLLDQPVQEEGFRALCGLGGDRPFECVGTMAECRSALLALSGLSGWSATHLVGLLAPELSGLPVARLEAMISLRGPHCIPAALVDHVDL